eukprot:4743216-Lingulodinium_polyedra.AAC.1
MVAPRPMGLKNNPGGAEALAHDGLKSHIGQRIAWDGAVVGGEGALVAAHDQPRSADQFSKPR